MEKKSFLKGLLIGLLSSLIICGVSVFAFTLKNVKMSITEKIGALAALLDKYYVEEIDFEKIEEGLYKGMADSLGDPYTTYLTADEYADLASYSEGSFEGIGIEIMADYANSQLTVISALDNSPALKAGIMPNDIILKIDDKKVTEFENLTEAINAIKGDEGSEVKITLYRPDTNKELVFSIKRSKIDEVTAKSEMFENSVGYIRLTHFTESTYEQFVKEYKALQSQNMKSLILDLRNNPGGLVNSVVKIADYIMPSGNIVYTIDKEGNKTDYNSESSAINVPITVLVNENSASASEILAGAIKDTKLGKLIGSRTFGKGLVQGVYPLKDGSALKVTMQKYYTPNGICIQGTGIEPDIDVRLSNPENIYNISKNLNLDEQLIKAIEIAKNY